LAGAVLAVVAVTFGREEPGGVAVLGYPDQLVEVEAIAALP
jgi:hypothetical protein